MASVHESEATELTKKCDVWSYEHKQWNKQRWSQTTMQLSVKFL